MLEAKFESKQEKFMALPFLPYAKQAIHEKDLQAVVEALKGDLITCGPSVQIFEQIVAEYCEVPYAVAFSSETAAWMAAYFAARLTSYDRLISTPNAFIATVGSALQLGIHPHFMDIDRSTGNLALSQLKEHLNFRSTRRRPFIVPMHFSGIAVDMEQLDRQICHPGAVVIEEAAHALGSSYPSGQKVGSCVFSQMTVFSFHPATIITTGEGGMVTTRDPELYHRLQLFRDNGIERHAPYLNTKPTLGYYEVQAITGNFNLTSFQAALGISQFRRLEEFISKRRFLVARYRHHLQNSPHFTLLTDQHDSFTAFRLFVVQIDFKAYRLTREEVMQALKAKGIDSQVHYIPLYHHPVLKNKQRNETLNCPETEIYYQQTLSLPLYFDLTEADVDRICHTLLTVLKK